MTTPLEIRLEDASLGNESHVGTLTRGHGRSGETIRFEYAPAWLDHNIHPWAFQIDPDIPLTSGPHHASGKTVLQGVFQDMSPDRWGRLLMERREAMEAKDEHRDVRPLRDWDFLTGVNDLTRMGALRLWNPETQSYVDNRELGAPPVARLRELEAIVAQLDRDGVEERPEYKQWLRQLIVPGTSLGGARPKASYMEDDGTTWMAKFPANDDRRDVGAWEYLTHQLAVQAGIVMPPARLFRFSDRGHTFAVKRFDREGGSRRMYASAMTLLQRKDGDAGSYMDIAEAIEMVGDPAAIAGDLEQLYRRIVFSILVGNRDDHLRNHGFLRFVDGWRLSLAFDINPNPDKDVHALAIDEGDHRPSMEHLRRTAEFYRLKDVQAAAIEDQVRTVVATWQEVAAGLGVSPRERAQMNSVIDHHR